MMPARTWGAHAVEISPTERLKLRRQMAAAAGKNNTEVGEELSTMATQYWAPKDVLKMLVQRARSVYWKK